MKIVGVDPGLTGAIAVLDGERLVDLWDMPLLPGAKGAKGKARIDVEELATLMHVVRGRGARHVVIEQVSAAPGQGVGGTFRFGEAFGLVRGVAAAAGLKETLAHPSLWKAAMRLGSDKARSRKAAAAVWPGDAKLFERVKDDGRAEAALLALWGVRALGTKVIS